MLHLTWVTTSEDRRVWATIRNTGPERPEQFEPGVPCYLNVAHDDPAIDILTWPKLTTAHSWQAVTKEVFGKSRQASAIPV